VLLTHCSFPLSPRPALTRAVFIIMRNTHKRMPCGEITEVMTNRCGFARVGHEQAAACGSGGPAASVRTWRRRTLSGPSPDSAVMTRPRWRRNHPAAGRSPGTSWRRRPARGPRSAMPPSPDAMWCAIACYMPAYCPQFSSCRSSFRLGSRPRR
jgi:hypothetical protein